MGETFTEQGGLSGHIRKTYETKLGPLIDKPVVKVITGMRRVGKSYLLRQTIAGLRARGVAANHILYIDKESLDFEHIAGYRDLDRAVGASFAARKGRKYLFVDEVQEIVEWERAIASLAKRTDMDIFVTGSNAQLFSSELATRLSGRCIEIPVFSLGFAEYLQFRGAAAGTREQEFLGHLRYGGLPAIHHFDLSDEVIYQYVSSIYDTVLLKDIVKRHGVRNVGLLENIARYLFDNVGKTMSAKRIADYLKAQRLRVGVDTVQGYLHHFCEAMVTYQVQRYDLKGKRLLEIHDKYYLADIGLRHALLGYREADVAGYLENVVFLELLRRGYRVHVGKIGDREVDFVATREGEKVYIQVAYLLASPETLEREVGALRAIPDNYPKLIVSMDTAFGGDLQGIRRLNLVDFLLQND